MISSVKSHSPVDPLCPPPHLLPVSSSITLHLHTLALATVLGQSPDVQAHLSPVTKN